MKLKPIVCIFLLGFLLGSCGDDEDAETDLELEIVTNLAFILPEGDEDSCVDTLEELIDPDFIGNSVTAPRAQFPKVALKWYDPDRSLTISSLTLIINHPQLQSTVILTGDELNSIFGLVDGIVGVGVEPDGEGGGGNVKQSFAPDPPDAAVRPTGLADCRLNFGGLDVNTETATDFTTGATVVVRGISVDAEDEDDPRSITARTSVRLSYEALDL